MVFILVIRTLVAKITFIVHQSYVFLGSLNEEVPLEMGLFDISHGAGNDILQMDIKNFLKIYTEILKSTVKHKLNNEKKNRDKFINNIFKKAIDNVYDTERDNRYVKISKERYDKYLYKKYLNDIKQIEIEKYDPVHKRDEYTSFIIYGIVFHRKYCGNNDNEDFNKKNNRKNVDKIQNDENDYDYNDKKNNENENNKKKRISKNTII
ncbi:hypothetical protein H8356DRAFT_1342926 [Neocallimastix lanati (nom. inval.)]|nr:hypothetical protein H8356DRAFT_1342926 [Neocallimastix sp. JGI-2020a]